MYKLMMYIMHTLYTINMLPEAVICTFCGAYTELIISLFCPTCCVLYRRGWLLIG